ncbi:MAG: hypothetical protein JOZ19_15390 [Rubrobacter sp.]|nr:hypothetical protein [Rubrobacter sp.]
MLTAAVQISSKVNAPTWLFVALYVLIGVVGIAAALVKRRKTRVDERRAWDQEVTSYLALGPGRSAELPQVSEVSPYQLGVSHSAYAPDDTHREDPYVHREEVDDRLRETLSRRDPPFVIVVGGLQIGEIAHHV